MATVRMKQLLEAGVHLGHRSRRWNPKMRSRIFTERNGIHIIDLQQTVEALEEAHAFVRDLAAEGGTIVFVGTKRQAQDNIREQAMRCGMPYVTQRWLGGTLTNFQTIRSRIDYFIDLEAQRERGEFEVLPKKEATQKVHELAKLERRLGGIRNLYQLPEALFVTDVTTEDIAVREANRLQIPVIAMVDTNCDPDPIDIVLPANDDAIRSILLISSLIADAVIEGQQMRGVIMEAPAEEVPEATEGGGAEYEQEAEPVLATEKETYAPTGEEEEDIIIIDEEADDEIEEEIEAE